MNNESKYKLGQKIFYIDDYELNRASIVRIEYDHDDNGNQNICYTVDKQHGDYVFNEDKLFETGEDAINDYVSKHNEIVKDLEKQLNKLKKKG